MNSRNAAYLTDLDPREWGGEIPLLAQERAWQQVQSVPVQRWSAYLNALCVELLGGESGGSQAGQPIAPLPLQLAAIPQLGRAQGRPQLGPKLLPGLWELVSGTAFQVDGVRLVVIPTEQIDDAELRVPQEWVDIPGWAAPYYLGVQLDLDAGWLRVWCHATHAELRQATYDSSDRTYALAQPNRDLAQLQVLLQQAGAIAPALTGQFAPQIAPLPELDPAQAQQLVARLGQPQLRLPRLEVPFSLWAALLSNPDWRAQLSAQRLGQPQPQLVRLKAWLKAEVEGAIETALEGVDGLWQRLQAAPAPAAGWRGPTSSPLASPKAPLVMPPFEISRVKILNFGTPSEPTSVALMVGVMPLESGQTRIGIQVLPLTEGLQSGLQVALLDDQSQVVGQMEAAAGESVQLQFSGSDGEQFRIEVQLGSGAVIEWFEI